MNLQRFTVDSRGCWEWQGSRTRRGYGRVWDDQRYHYAHRAAWEAHRGPIPPELTVDHLCRNRACVNPAHMALVSPAENTMRGDSPLARKARQTHCIHGHLLAGDNLHVRLDGRRQCRVCDRERARIRRGAKRLAASPRPEEGAQVL